MATPLFTHPFEVLLAGGVGTALQGSDLYVASQLSVIVGTRLGERQMCPPFGVHDAAYGRVVAADVQTCLDRYGPDGVKVNSVTEKRVSDRMDAVQIEWART